MPDISNLDCIRCRFGPTPEIIPGFKPAKPEIHYAETKNLAFLLPKLKNYLSDDEQIKANRIRSEQDRETYISCHSILRLLISKKLNSKPEGIYFIIGANNKPGLPGNLLFFNISHTKNAFAIAFSRDYHVGIDLEEVRKSIDISTIVETYFSKKERSFIFSSDEKEEERFLLLWTRKEALLKAIGTGIIDDLTQIEVSEPENLVNRKLFSDIALDCDLHDQFVYSKKLRNAYLSIAIPYQSEIDIDFIRYENLII
jgi:4'-phosphopantetheinyl transferase